MLDFHEFAKIARLSRECVITEKIDGTNASIWIDECHPDNYAEVPRILAVRDGYPQILRAGSRNDFITPERDNFGFAAWVKAHADEFWTLGLGAHYGEWWGSGVQRGYGLMKGDKRFSLFNVSRWHAAGAVPYASVSADPRIAPKSSTEAPACCGVVPVLYRGEFASLEIEQALSFLRTDGSVASPGFKPAEGIVIYHTAAGQYFKKTIEKDEEPKSRHVPTQAMGETTSAATR